MSLYLYNEQKGEGTMKVIKRDGRLQEFDLDKIIRSIGAASDDAGKPLNTSDLHNIARDIEKSIKKLGKEQISFDEIRTIVIDTLEKNGFKDVAKAYMNF